jgi:hypothetical protein
VAVMFKTIWVFEQISEANFITISMDYTYAWLLYEYDLPVVSIPIKKKSLVLVSSNSAWCLPLETSCPLPNTGIIWLGMKGV